MIRVQSHSEMDYIGTCDQLDVQGKRVGVVKKPQGLMSLIIIFKVFRA